MDIVMFEIILITASVSVLLLLALVSYFISKLTGDISRRFLAIFLLTGALFLLVSAPISCVLTLFLSISGPFCCCFLSPFASINVKTEAVR
jgi:hypothetical protein